MSNGSWLPCVVLQWVAAIRGRTGCTKIPYTTRTRWRRCGVRHGRTTKATSATGTIRLRWDTVSRSGESRAEVSFATSTTCVVSWVMFNNRTIEYFFIGTTDKPVSSYFAAYKPDLDFGFFFFGLKPFFLSRNRKSVPYFWIHSMTRNNIRFYSEYTLLQLDLKRVWLTAIKI